MLKKRKWHWHGSTCRKPWSVLLVSICTKFMLQISCRNAKRAEKLTDATLLQLLHFNMQNTTVNKRLHNTNEIFCCIMQTLRRMTSSWDISEVWFWVFVCIWSDGWHLSFWTYLSSMFSGLLNAFLTFRTNKYPNGMIVCPWCTITDSAH